MRQDFKNATGMLEPRLRKPTTVCEGEVFHCDSYHSKLEGILKEPKKRNGRTDGAIKADIMAGTVAEVGIAKLLKTEVYDEVFDLKNRSTFSKDIVYCGLRIEVKSHKHLRRFSVVSHSYKTMMNSWGDKGFDVVLFAHIERTETPGYWTVTPTLIVDPYYDQDIVPFWNLWERDDFSYVYRADQAVKRDLCYPLIELEQ